MTKFLAAVSLVAALAVSGTAFADSKSSAPSLPSADRIEPSIKHTLGEFARADVRLCLASDGHVTSVGIVKSSSFGAFDRAVVSDAKGWRFGSSDATRRCMRTTVEYHTK